MGFTHLLSFLLAVDLRRKAGSDRPKQSNTPNMLIMGKINVVKCVLSLGYLNCHTLEELDLDFI